MSTPTRPSKDQSTIPSFNKHQFSYAPFSDPRVASTFRVICTIFYTLPTLAAIGSVSLCYIYTDLEDVLEDYFFLVAIPIIIYAIILYFQSSSIIVARKLPFNYLLYFIGLLCYATIFAFTGSRFSIKKAFMFLWLEFAASIAIAFYSLVSRSVFSLVHVSLAMMFNLVLTCIILFLIYRKKLFVLAFLCLFNLVSGFLAAFNLYSMIENFDFELMPDDFIMGSSRMSTDFLVSVMRKPRAQTNDFHSEDIEDPIEFK